jgi:predicted GIY-YIG superfamily endonuclease
MTEQLGNLAGKCGIYKISFPNGHYYFGQSVDLKRRRSNHLLELKKGKHSNQRLQNCYNKYQTFDFELIHECKEEELNSIESKYLFKHIDDEMCCNMCKEGRSPLGIKRSNECRKKISDYQRLGSKIKPVYMFTRDNMFMVARYESITDATKAIDCGPKDIQKSCKSNGKYNVKGYKFLFAEQVDSFLQEVSRIIKLKP